MIFASMINKKKKKKNVYTKITYRIKPIYTKINK